MKRLPFAAPLLTILIFIFTIQAGDKKTRLPVKCSAGDPVATHNMLVVGEKTIYLSHLPMFPETASDVMPHRYQAILEVSFKKKGSKPDADYMKDRQRHPGIKIYTINPEPFVLPELVAAGLPSVPLQKFTAGVFRGHLEKGGSRLLPGLEVTVKRVVYFQQFDTVARKPAGLEYLLFGKGKELFLTHLIMSPPDFDQVVAVAVTGHSFTNEVLAKGVKLIISGSVNTAAARLKEKQLVAATFILSDTAAPAKIQLKVSREIYFEEGELQVPANFDTTPEEKKAGFP